MVNDGDNDDCFEKITSEINVGRFEKEWRKKITTVVFVESTTTKTRGHTCNVRSSRENKNRVGEIRYETTTRTHDLISNIIPMRAHDGRRLWKTKDFRVNRLDINKR